MTRTVARLLAICLLVAFGAANARAECVGFPLDHYRKYADVVFRGVMTDIQRLDESRAVVTFTVSRVWKGNVGRRFVLHQGHQLGPDRYSWPAEAAGEYLVFATRLDESDRKAFDLTNRNAFAVPMCWGGTTPISHARAPDFLRQLGPGRAP